MHDSSPRPIACDLYALTPDERDLRSTLAQALRAAVVELRELPDGFEVAVAAQDPVVRELPELIALESRCCPFLDLELRSAGDRTLLRMTGREGVKDFLQVAFGFAKGSCP